MSYQMNPSSANCYPGTTVLVNKWNIRDEAVLHQAEAMVTLTKATELEECPLCGDFDFRHYREIHRYLFSELYEWAGEIRTVNLSKKGTRFCPAEQINERAEQIFGRLQAEKLFREKEHGAFVSEIVDFYCLTNELHPFREGNGRTQRAFLTQLIRNAGHDIHFADIDGDLLMIATIQAAQGVTDLLHRIFREAIE